MNSPRVTAWLIAATAMLIAESGLAAAGPPDVDFNRDIRPILSESCYQCHGPDRNKLKADLRLDTRDGLFRSADGSTIVVPGKPDDSELLLRIVAEDDETRMPPPKAGKRLTARPGGASPSMDRARGGLEGSLGLHRTRSAGRLRPARRGRPDRPAAPDLAWTPRDWSPPPRPTARH